ncbi:ORC-CDC6 family AAA ATPase [Lysobacter sp. 1R34A]|uniref:ORC-CDC6 family AAA ATPase n=1 Tax=Lysobacter sp. 1R34A TaxID=3445786 RepID=UPI003EEBB66F
MSTWQAAVSGNVFNARDLRSQDVAGRFVVPAAFANLLEDYHCVLEGPRGSGKTTLLRMLTPEAFAIWRESEAGNSLNFIGVFVPADVRWAKQLETKLDGVDNAALRKNLMEAAFSVATSLALLQTLESCAAGYPRFGERHPNIFFPIDRDREVLVVKALAAIWNIKVDVPSFFGLKLALRVRQHHIGALSFSFANEKVKSNLSAEDAFVSSSWLENIVTAVETINEVVGRHDQRWAILLDELEIVPQEILETIVQAFRSTSPLIKLKLALSPTGTDLISNGDSAAPTPNNDYRPVQLWYERREDARAFSERLFHEALKRFGVLGDQDDLMSIFGPNLIGGSEDDEPEEDLSISLAAKRERIEAFKSLYKKDESFKRILDKKGIDPTSPPISDSSPNGTFVRKITPLVCLRDREIESFTDEKGVRKKGGRRGQDAYLGYPNLIDLAEGNPRWVLTMADLLYSTSKQRGQSISAQGVHSIVISDFVDQFISKLMVYPTGKISIGKNWTLMRFVNALGKCLAESLYGQDFNSDPAMSFYIDKRALGQYAEYIRLCIDLGVLVIIRAGSVAPLAGATGGNSLEDARVRISYRLAPEFRLPLRSTKERSISGALKGGGLLESEQSLLVSLDSPHIMFENPQRKLL